MFLLGLVQPAHIVDISMLLYFIVGYMSNHFAAHDCCLSPHWPNVILSDVSFDLSPLVHPQLVGFPMKTITAWGWWHWSTTQCMSGNPENRHGSPGFPVKSLETQKNHRETTTCRPSKGSHRRWGTTSDGVPTFWCLAVLEALHCKASKVASKILERAEAGRKGDHKRLA